MAISTQLFELERLDTDLLSLQKHLHDLRRLLQESPQVRVAEDHLASLQTRLHDLQRQQRVLEAELADVEARIARDQGRIYGGQVVDPREIATLEREVLHDREKRDPLEDRLLTIMEQVDTLAPQVAAAQRAAQEARAQWESGKPDGTRRAQETAGALAELRADRERLAAQIDPRTLEQYTRLRRTQGNAVSLITGGICQWCRVGIPAKDVQHVRAGQLVTCPNCTRILHAAS